MSPPIVHLCAGKHCSGAKRDQRALIEALAGVAEVNAAKCQKICKPPVVGVEHDGERTWFGPIDTKKSRRRLVELVETGRLRKALAKRRRSRR